MHGERCAHGVWANNEGNGGMHHCVFASLHHLYGPLFAFVCHSHVDQTDGFAARVVVVVVNILKFHIKMAHLYT